MKQKINKEEFSSLLLKSISDIKSFNSKMRELGITIKPFTGYEYYYENNFICSTEDLCVDDILEKLGFEIEE